MRRFTSSGKWGKSDQERGCSPVSDDGYQIAGESYDQVILATEPGWGQILSHLATKLMSRPQKGATAGLSARPRYCWLSCGHAWRRSWISFHSKMERSVMGATPWKWDGLWPDSGSSSSKSDGRRGLDLYPELAQAWKLLASAVNSCLHQWLSPFWGSCSWSKLGLYVRQWLRFVWPLGRSPHWVAPSPTSGRRRVRLDPSRLSSWTVCEKKWKLGQES